MSDTNAEQNADRLSAEILDALEQPGQLKSWLRKRSEAPSDAASLDEACVLVTEALLGAEPARAGEWEQLIIQLAVHSHETNGPRALDRCKSVLAKLHEMLESDGFVNSDPQVVITMAGSLTIALTAERKLRQPIEEVMKSLCGKLESEVAQIGQQCQDIWRRKGQMSGEPGLFLWDTRNGEWRLTQDFKANQPDR